MARKPPLPTLGYQPRSNPLGKVFVTSLLLGGLSGGAYWVWKGRTRDGAAFLPEAPQQAPQQAQAPARGQAQAPAVPAVTPTPAPQGAAPEARVAQATAAPAAPGVKQGLQRASVRINGPLETVLVEAAGAEVGPALAQVVTRSLVWWVQVPGELMKGDTLDVLYEVPPGEEPLLHALRFTSGKMGKTFASYRFKAPGDAFARYYEPSGDELEQRLENSPIDEYEQVTSLLRDGRRHKGVDFKAPVGTPVKAPFSGVITRRNWNWRGNGNCIEVTESGGRGRRALFLHLDELPATANVGARVHVGQVLARSGNSGHSFAPHLHYQMMLGEEKVLDPFDQHRTYRHSLAASAKGAFEAEKSRLDGLLSGGNTSSASR